MAFSQVEATHEGGYPVDNEKDNQRRQPVSDAPNTTPVASRASEWPRRDGAKAEKRKQRQRRLDEPAVRKEVPPAVDAVPAVEKTRKPARPVDDVRHAEDVRLWKDSGA